MRQLVLFILISCLVAPELASAHGGGLNAEVVISIERLGSITAIVNPASLIKKVGSTQKTKRPRASYWNLNQDDTCNGLLPYGVPSKGDHLLCRTAYSVGFDCSNRSAAWVAYRVSLEISDSANVERSDDFRPDPELPQECRKNS